MLGFLGARVWARAAPMPIEAPVISMFLFFNAMITVIG